jgi:curli biogenesis system outer membrane secretion channel CsgG
MPVMIRCLLASALLLVGACSTVHITIPVMKPAEINVARYKQIGLDHLQNDHGDQVTSLLKAALVESNRFVVLDRQNLNLVSNEQRMAAGPNATGDNVQLGQQLVASALILGTVTHSGYQEGMDRSEYDTKDSRGYSTHHVAYTRRGSAKVHVSLQVTDVTSGQIIKAKDLEYTVQDSRYSVDEYPQQLNRDDMLENARKHVVRAFVMAITPHQVNMEVAFLLDGKLPQLEAAINLVKVSQYADAEKTISDAIDLAEKSGLPTKTLAKAYWDRGLIYEYSGRFAPARVDVRKAYEYQQDADFLAELRHIDTRESDEKRLKDQGVGASAATAEVGDN